MDRLRAGDIGERGLIELIWGLVDRQLLGEPAENPLPHPDDASALLLPGGRFLVLKTDMFVRRTDAPRGMRHYQMGRKSVVMCASDLAAKGAKPHAFMHSMGVPPSYPSGGVLDLVRGLLSACKEYGVAFLGGDLGESKDLVVAGFMVGFADRIVRRSGASPGDLLAVTGHFGETASALEILLKGRSAPPPLRRRLLRSVYQPRARVDLGVALAGTGAVTSSMDSSDGLAFTLHELARSSGVRFVIYKVPVSRAAEEFASIHGIPAEELALYGGEEYEFVLTIKPEAYDRAQAAAERCGNSLLPIGRVEEGRGVFLSDGTLERPIEAKGWEHLSCP
ncbi:MAG: thiamine-phosphate kinase [Candidatus Methanosuratincola sp.]|nr:thiamine-phosphate kinase [Candidatus Methanosuratincola sp.]